MQHIFSKKQNCRQLRSKQQGYILISLMASLVILGLIAINEYMHLVKKQQLDRAETAATQIVSVANTLGDAIYEPTEMFNKNKVLKNEVLKNEALKQDITEISTQWQDESKKNGGWVTLQTFYETPDLSAVCGMSYPPITQSQSFPSCLVARKKINSFNDQYRSLCRCVNQKIKYAGFLNLIPKNIVMRPIGGGYNKIPQSILLRVPYPELGGKADSGLALRILTHIKKNLIDTPKLKFAVCMGELKNQGLISNQFTCEADVDSVDAFDSTHLNQQYIYIYIERKV
ncbi:pilus assembly FimT family protein [Cysteiniphilum sp. 6C5]|uniref:pilus assembly FimT family protein n=1 Tax=unclassified Cysteiniphilum TaxID=2610889 RepID=UPI003F8546E4